MNLEQIRTLIKQREELSRKEKSPEVNAEARKIAMTLLDAIPYLIAHVDAYEKVVQAREFWLSDKKGI